MQDILLQSKINEQNFSDKNIAVSQKKVNKLPEIRCKNCNKLLFLGKVQYVEIKCPKCKRVQKIGQQNSNIC